jgi:hypothetical protein
MSGFQMRVENECRGRLLLVQPVKHAVDERGLARPDFAREQDKTLAGLYPVRQFVQRLPRLRGQIQVPWVRIDVEGVFAQSKELFVHVGLGSAAVMFGRVNFRMIITSNDQLMYGGFSGGLSPVVRLECP